MKWSFASILISLVLFFFISPPCSGTQGTPWNAEQSRKKLQKRVTEIVSSHTIDRSIPLIKELDTLCTSYVEKLKARPWDMSPHALDSEGLVSLYMAGAIIGESAGEKYRKFALELISPPVRKVERHGNLSCKLLKNGDPRFREAALTFDDGPGPYTDDLLSVLARHNVKATFFIIGCQITKYPKVIQRMYKEGHLIANHSWKHARMPKLTNQTIHTRLDWFHNQLEKTLGESYDCRYFRLPFNSGKKNSRVNAVMAKRFDEIVDWTVDPRDWDYRCRPKVVKTVTSYPRKKGSIILLHDNLKAAHVAAQTDAIITKMKEQDFVFLTLDGLLGRDDRSRIRYILAQAIKKAEANCFMEAYKLALKVPRQWPEAKEADDCLALAELLALFKGNKEQESADKVRRFMTYRYPGSSFATSGTE